MKKITAALLSAGLFCMQHAMAQTPSQNLKLSTDYPEVEKKITVIYDSVGTVVGGKKDIAAIVYFFDNKVYPVADIVLKPSGSTFKGDFKIPATATAFAIKVIAEDKTDNNHDNGYLYAVYKDKQPVPGAYAMEGYANAGTGANLGAMRVNMDKALDLYKKEFELHPELEKAYQDPYYVYLNRSATEKVLATEKLDKLKKSDDEKDLILAANIQADQRQRDEAQILFNDIQNRFPNGIYNKNVLINTVYKEKDPATKEQLYKAYKTKYPTGDEENDERLKTNIAVAYLYAGKLDDFRRVEATLKSRQDLIAPLNDVAYSMAQKDDRIDEAEKLSAQSIEMSKPLTEKPQFISFRAPSQVQKYNLSDYANFQDTYAYIMFKQNKPGEALKHEQMAVAGGRGNTENYILILDALGKTDEVITKAEECVKTEHTTALINEKLKKNYVAKHGNDIGYDTYFAGLVKVAKDKAKNALALTMIDEPAPDFSLRDLNGKLVSLSSLKGKTVVVDFWATWCGPCKASFPGMQMAVNKYKDNSNIEFLFVDTWEYADDYVTGVKNFIDANKYSFHVLIDDKIETGKQAKVVSAYGVNGIPTKFVIDKNGKIRFKYVGYYGSADKVVDEVDNMLELTQLAADKKNTEVSSNVKEK